MRRPSTPGLQAHLPPSLLGSLPRAVLDVAAAPLLKAPIHWVQAQFLGHYVDNATTRQFRKNGT